MGFSCQEAKFYFHATLYSVQRNPLTWAMQCWRSQERNVAWGSTTRTFNNALHLQMCGFLQSWQQRDLVLILCIVIKPGFVFKRAFKGVLMTPTPNTTVDLNKHWPRWGLAPFLRLSAEVTNWRVSVAAFIAMPEGTLSCNWTTSALDFYLDLPQCKCSYSSWDLKEWRDW